MQKSSAPVPSDVPQQTYGYQQAAVNDIPYHQQQQQIPSGQAVVMVGAPAQGVATVNNYNGQRLWILIESLIVGGIGAWMYLWSLGSAYVVAILIAIGMGYTAVCGLLAAGTKNRAMIVLHMVGLFFVGAYYLISAIYFLSGAGDVQVYTAAYAIWFGICLVAGVSFGVCLQLYRSVTKDLRSVQEFQQGLVQGIPAGQTY